MKETRALKDRPIARVILAGYEGWCERCRDQSDVLTYRMAKDWVEEHNSIEHPGVTP